MDDVIFLFLEIRDLGVALHQQIQGRGLDTSHGQGLVVQHGEKPGGIDAHQPIRLGPAQGRLIQRVIVRSRFQVCKAVFNGAVLHTGNPKTLERLFTPRHLVNKTENQFSLAPGIGGAHKAGHVGALQISVVLLRGPDHARNTAGDTRFFCNYQLITHSSSSCSVSVSSDSSSKSSSSPKSYSSKSSLPLVSALGFLNLK